MDSAVNIWETPTGQESYMIVGWEQWADAGQCSSGLPRYLIEQVGARKIGQIDPDGFYLFQIPGTHHLLRPEVELEDGYRQGITTHRNELYFAQVNGKGLYIFTGEEPHYNEQRYAEAFFDMVEAVEVKRVVAMGGVFGPMPYDRDREVSCVYSLPRLKKELDQYALRFSNYTGGSTIGTYLAHWAEYREIEFIVLYAFAPAYEFSQLGVTLQSFRIDEDWKGWLDLMRRVEYMFQLGLDLSDLQEQSQALIEAWDERIEKAEQEHPELHIRNYMDEVAKEYHERPFIPLDDAWDELGDLLQDIEPPGDGQ